MILFLFVDSVILKVCQEVVVCTKNKKYSTIGERIPPHGSDIFFKFTCILCLPEVCFKCTVFVDGVVVVFDI